MAELEESAEWTTRHYTYTSPAADRAAELSAIVGDLEEAQHALDLLLEPTDSVTEPEAVTQHALWTYAVVQYARVFVNGKRRNARPFLAPLAEEWPEYLDTHEHVMGLRDKHIAHPVSLLERAGTVIEFEEHKSGKVRFRALGMTVWASGPMNPAIKADFRRLVTALLEIIRREESRAWEVVNTEVRAAMTPDDIQRLPLDPGIQAPGPGSWRTERRPTGPRSGRGTRRRGR